MPENKPDIEGLKNYLEEYIKSLETIMAAEGLLDPVKQRSIMDYMELDNYNLNSKRYITTDEIIAVLPEECNSADRDLAQRITYLTTQRIKNIKEAHQEFKDIDPIPIPIVFYNSTEEVSKVARKPKYAGVMSLQNGPLFNTFNLEAAFGLENAMAELEMVNPSLSSHKNDIAEKLMLYSALHETTHTLVERLRLRYCLDKGISMEQYVKSFHKINKENSIAWELAACEMMPDTVRFDEKNVFPYAVAKAPETKIDFTRIVQEKNIDLFGNDQKIHMNPIVPGTGHEISFVASPYCAYIYKELIDMTDRYRQLHDTHFTWIGHTLNYIKAHPLADAPFEMPKRFRPTI